MFQFLLLICLIFTINCNDVILDKLRAELELSKTAKEDTVLPFLCKLLPSQEFIKESNDEDLLSSMLYELGFGVLGVKPNSWGAKLRNNAKKPASCFAALHSTASSDVTKTTLASSRRIISRCCDSKDL